MCVFFPHLSHKLGRGEDENFMTFKKGHKTNIGRICSLKTKEKLRNSKLGDRNPMFGKKHSVKTEKKIVKAMNKGLKRFYDNGGVAPMKGKIKEKNPSWKGENALYSAKHRWIRRHYGNPDKCEDCGTIGNKVNGRWNIDWSNIDHKYRRNREDYSGRCHECHDKYDKANGLK